MSHGCLYEKVDMSIPAILAMIVGMPYEWAKEVTETAPPDPGADAAICIHVVSIMLLVTPISN
jgi:hypothetical protein